MTAEYQDELFEEFKKEEPALAQLAKKVLPRKRPHILHFPLEGVIVAAILILLLVIIAFALGVETGKRQAAIRPQDITNIPAMTAKTLETPPVYEPQDVTKTEAVKKPEPEIEKPYTIQIIAYKDRKKALAKVKDLNAKGSEAAIIEKNGWFQVCVGSYHNKKDAERDMARFLSEYKGSFLREKE